MSKNLKVPLVVTGSETNISSGGNPRDPSRNLFGYVPRTQQNPQRLRVPGQAQQSTMQDQLAGLPPENIRIASIGEIMQPPSMVTRSNNRPSGIPLRKVGSQTAAFSKLKTQVRQVPETRAENIFMQPTATRTIYRQNPSPQNIPMWRADNQPTESFGRQQFQNVQIPVKPTGSDRFGKPFQRQIPIRKVESRPMSRQPSFQRTSAIPQSRVEARSVTSDRFGKRSFQGKLEVPIIKVDNRPVAPKSFNRQQPVQKTPQVSLKRAELRPSSTERFGARLMQRTSGTQFKKVETRPTVPLVQSVNKSGGIATSNIQSFRQPKNTYIPAPKTSQVVQKPLSPIQPEINVPDYAVDKNIPPKIPLASKPAPKIRNLPYGGQKRVKKVYDENEDIQEGFYNIPLQQKENIGEKHRLVNIQKSSPLGLRQKIDKNLNIAMRQWANRPKRTDVLDISPIRGRYPDVLSGQFQIGSARPYRDEEFLTQEPQNLNQRFEPGNEYYMENLENLPLEDMSLPSFGSLSKLFEDSDALLNEISFAPASYVSFEEQFLDDAQKMSPFTSENISESFPAYETPPFLDDMSIDHIGVESFYTEPPSFLMAEEKPGGFVQMPRISFPETPGWDVVKYKRKLRDSVYPETVDSLYSVSSSDYQRDPLVSFPTISLNESQVSHSPFSKLLLEAQDLTESFPSEPPSFSFAEENRDMTRSGEISFNLNESFRPQMSSTLRQRDLSPVRYQTGRSLRQLPAITYPREPMRMIEASRDRNEIVPYKPPYPAFSPIIEKHLGTPSMSSTASPVQRSPIVRRFQQSPADQISDSISYESSIFSPPEESPQIISPVTPPRRPSPARRLQESPEITSVVTTADRLPFSEILAEGQVLSESFPYPPSVSTSPEKLEITPSGSPQSEMNAFARMESFPSKSLPLEIPKPPEDLPDEETIAATILNNEELGIHLEKSPSVIFNYLFCQDEKETTTALDVSKRLESPDAVQTLVISGKSYTKLKDEDVKYDESDVKPFYTPKHCSKVQLRGSNHPSWFPGYYMAEPKAPNIQLIQDTDTAIKSAWNAVYSINAAE